VLTHLAAEADAAGPIADAAFLGRARSAAKGREPRFKLAARIAINRTVAGVHFPVDSAAGAVLGVTLGEYLVARATGRTTTNRRTFDGRRYGEEDFDPAVLAGLLEAGEYGRTSAGVVATAQAPVGGASPLLEWLWTQAMQEIGGRWGN
ncbi:MAG TPA: hypothetical protein VD813_13380, partial [Pseudonocardia sp.]|nr:hypothetical protein [Pseudonocardia sp.]